jgi:hypothetical protein
LNFFIFLLINMFEAAAFREISQANQNDYVNARYAPIGNETVGKPFPLFRQPASYFTDWTPAGQTPALLNLQMNLPTDNTLARNTQQSDGVSLGNKQNTAFVFRTQTLSNNGTPIACRNNSDCSSWPGTTCNPQYMSWPDAKGNQGNYCSVTKYPEMETGTYNRKLTNEGGIGRACSSDNDCGTGYYCNNVTDMFGKNIQQTGYCTKIYQCQDGSHYLGHPYNSGIPAVPPANQNNNGKGYSTEDDCRHNKLAQQDCKQDASGNWFATYPGYCPVITNLRSNAHPQGMLPSSSMVAQNTGISLPGYATSAGSSMKAPAAFTSWNINASPMNAQQMGDPLSYELAINPRG